MSWNLTKHRRRQIYAALIWVACMCATTLWIATCWNWSKPW